MQDEGSESKGAKSRGKREIRTNSLGVYAFVVKTLAANAGGKRKRASN